MPGCYNGGFMKGEREIDMFGISQETRHDLIEEMSSVRDAVLALEKLDGLLQKGGKLAVKQTSEVIGTSEVMVSKLVSDIGLRTDEEGFIYRPVEGDLTVDFRERFKTTSQKLHRHPGLSDTEDTNLQPGEHPADKI